MARTKEYRRFMQSTKLEKRIKMYSEGKKRWLKEITSNAEYKEKVIKGEVDQFLKNTGVACSCYMCSGHYKYNRPTTNEMLKIINDEYPLNFKRKSD